MHASGRVAVTKTMVVTEVRTTVALRRRVASRERPGPEREEVALRGAEAEQAVVVAASAA